VAYKDVEQDKASLAEMTGLCRGRRDVPVIVEDGKVTIGYGGS
jgi:glutaredoxin 3